MENTREKINWNGLNVQTDDYYATWEYSENFKDYFGSIFAKLTKLKRNPSLSDTIKPEEADKYLDKYHQLKMDLLSRKIKLDTQDKADKILDELHYFLKDNFND